MASVQTQSESSSKKSLIVRQKMETFNLGWIFLLVGRSRAEIISGEYYTLESVQYTGHR